MERRRRFPQWLDTGLIWPLSNWLWASIVNPLVAGVRQLTPRRLVYLAAFVLVAWSAAGFLSADMVAMLAGDTALYFEIATFFYLAIARNRVHRAIAPAVQMVRATVRRAGGRIAARSRRPMRLPRLFDKDDADVPDGAFA